MTSDVIKINNLYKEYHLGSVGRGYYRDLQSLWAKIRNKPDPNLIDSNFNLTKKNLIALNDINLTIKRRNCWNYWRKRCRKIYFTKILSRITGPTKGRIEITGKVASLLEVSTGFHQE